MFPDREKLMKPAVQSADPRTARLRPDVNIIRHQTRAEPGGLHGAHNMQQRPTHRRRRERGTLTERDTERRMDKNVV